GAVPLRGHGPLRADGEGRGVAGGPASPHDGGAAHRGRALGSVKRLCVVLVSLAVVTGVVLRLAWCEQRNAAASRRVSWRSLVLWEPANEKFPFLHDEYLYYVSTAVNAFKGDGFFPDYNRARDGVYVP